MSDHPIDVLVADSSRMQCELLASSLLRRGGFKLIGYATRSVEALRTLRDRQPDIALVSANLQDGPRTGLQIPRQLNGGFKTQCIILLDNPDKELVVEAFRSGAKGVFCRAESFQGLRKCIFSVHQGQIWASSQELRFVLEALAQPVQPRIVNACGAPLLTKREETVVHLVSIGLPNRDIALKLNLSEHTVKNYLSHVYEKLGISGRVELVLYALTQRQAANSVSALPSLSAGVNQNSREGQARP